MTFAEQVKDARGLRSQEEAARVLIDAGLKVSMRALAGYERGEREPETLKQQAILEALRKPSGDGVRSTALARISAGDAVPSGIDLVLYPYAPHGHSGDWAGRSNAGMEGHEQIALHRSFLMARLGRVPDPNKTYWTHLVGSSMMPWLRDGQMIGIERTDAITTDDRYALYLDDAEEEIVKRVNRLGGKRLRLIADNPAYGSQEIQHIEDDLYRDVARQHTMRMRVLGRVIEPPDDAQAIFATAIAAVRGIAQ